MRGRRSYLISASLLALLAGQPVSASTIPDADVSARIEQASRRLLLLDAGPAVTRDHLIREAKSSKKRNWSDWGDWANWTNVWTDWADWANWADWADWGDWGDWGNY